MTKLRRRWSVIAFTVLLAWLVVSLIQSRPAFAAAEEGFQVVFNGKDFTGWKFFFPSPRDHDPSKTFRLENGVIMSSGWPPGSMCTDKEYRDFTLRFDWRYQRPQSLVADSDFVGGARYMLFVKVRNGEPIWHRTFYSTWPKSLAFQGRYRGVGNVIPESITARYETDRAARKRAQKQVGEWNTYELVSSGGVVTASVNAVKISTVTQHELKGIAGRICFGSERGDGLTSEINWRNIRLKVEP